MSIESKLAGINIYYSTHISFILETVISTMKFWGYNTTIMGDGSIKAIKDKTRRFLFNSQNTENDPVINDKLEKINSQINQKPETIKGHILNMGLIYCFSLFEAFNKDYFQEVFIFKPDLMKSKKIKMSLEYLLQFKTIEELHRSLSKNLIENFGYKDIDKLAELIIKKFNIEFL